MVVTLLVLAGCGGTDEGNENINENANVENNTEVNENANNEEAVNEEENELDLSTLDALSAEEVLAEDPDADIFQYEGVVYKTEGELAEDVGVTLKELIGKVTKKVDADTEFEDGMATELMPNVKIYSTNEEDLTVLLVEVHNDKYVYYAQLNE